MSTRTDTVNLRVIVNGSAAKKELAELDKEYLSLREHMRGLKKGTDEYVAAQKRMGEVTSRMSELRKELGLTSMTLRDLNKEATKLRMMRQYLTPGTEEFNRINAQLTAVNARIREVNTGLGPFASAWKKVSMEAKAAVGFLAAQQIFTYFENIVKGAGRLDDQLADVRKTTDMTDKELESLLGTLRKYDSRTSVADLLDISKVGGQFGIAKDQIESFTLAIDKVNVAVGDEFSGGAEEVATSLGVLRNNLKDIKSENVGDDIMYMANALNELSAKGAATVPVMVDIGNRTGGVLSNMGVATGKILGMAAAMQELGISEERGSTALVKTYQKMIGNAEDFAYVAGMNVAKFKKLLDTDLYAAFIKVMEGSQRLGDSNTKLNTIIEDLQMRGAGASELFSKFGGNLELVKNRVDIATEALSNMDSVTNEFNIKNTTLAATMEKMKRELHGLFVNNRVKEMLTGWVNGFADLIKSIKENSDGIAFFFKIVATATTAILSYAAAKKIATLWSNNAAKASILESVALKTLTIAQNTERAATLLGAAAKALLAGNINRATAAMRAFKTLTGVSPLGILISAIMAGVAAYQLFNKEVDRAAERQKELDEIEKSRTASMNAELKSTAALFEQLKKTNPQSEERKNLMAQINQMYGTTLQNLSDEKQFLDQVAKAQDAVIDGIKRKVEAKIQEEKLDKLMREREEMSAKYSKTTADYLVAQETEKRRAETAKARITSVGKEETDAYQTGALQFASTRRVQLQNQVLAEKAALDQINADIDAIAKKYAKTISLDIVSDSSFDLGNKKMTEKEEKALDKRLKAHKKEYEDFIKFLNENNESILSSLMSDEEKVTHEVGSKYAERLMIVQAAIKTETDLIKKGVGDRTRLSELENSKLVLSSQMTNELKIKLAEIAAEKAKKYAADRLEAEKDITDGILNEQEKQELAIVRYYDNLIKLNTKFHITEVDLEKKKQEALEAIRKKFKDAENKKNKKQLEQWQLDLQDFLGDARKVYADLQTVAESVIQNIANKEQAEFNAYKANQEKKHASLQERFDNGLISEETYNNEKARLDKETNDKERAMKRQQWERDKAAKIGMAAINTALAVVNALATAPWPTNIGFAAVAAAAGIAQTAVIASTPPPEFRQGTILDGPSHDTPGRGMPITDPRTGRIAAYVEGGEGIIPKNVVAKNRTLVEQMIAAGKGDGSLDSVNFRNITRNLESSQHRRYTPNPDYSPVDPDSPKRVPARGGDSVSSDKYISELVSQNRELLAEIKRLRNDVREEKTRPAIISERQMLKSTEERNRIRRLAGA